MTSIDEHAAATANMNAAAAATASDDDAKDDGENDDNAIGGVYSEYVRNTDDLLVVAEKLSSLL